MVTCIPEDSLCGLSADAKPLNVDNGTAFYEMDTGKMYMFDAENKAWLEQ